MQIEIQILKFLEISWVSVDLKMAADEERDEARR